jgi:hypothetical protein
MLWNLGGFGVLGLMTCHVFCRDAWFVFVFLFEMLE